MPTLRTIRKPPTAGLSAEDTRASQGKTNETIDLMDEDLPSLSQYKDESDDEDDDEVIEVIRPPQKPAGNKKRKRKMKIQSKAKSGAVKHGLKCFKTNKTKSVSAARPRNDEEREHCKKQASMGGLLTFHLDRRKNQGQKW